MAKIGTRCSECYFYSPFSMNCTIGKHEIFHSVGAKLIKLDNDVMIDRICRFRRTPDWVEQNGADLDQIRKDIAICGTILVVADSATKDQLAHTIELLQLTVGIDRFKVIVGHDDSISTSDVKSVCKDTGLDIIYIKSFCETSKESINEYFRKSKNGYIFILEAGKEIDICMIEKLDYILNDLLMPLIYVDSEELHCCVCQAVIFNYLKGYKAIDLKEKVVALAEQQNMTSMIMTWESINERYSSR